MDIITQAIIGGIFTLLGVYFRHVLENRRRRSSLQPLTPADPPKINLKKGFKRLLWGIAILIFAMFITPESGDELDKLIPALIGFFAFFTIFSGIFMILKGFIRYIFS